MDLVKGEWFDLYSNTDLWSVEQVKEKLMELSYIREELESWENR